MKNNFVVVVTKSGFAVKHEKTGLYHTGTGLFSKSAKFFKTMEEAEIVAELYNDLEKMNEGEK